jgi:hypothetical protein
MQLFIHDKRRFVYVSSAGPDFAVGGGGGFSRGESGKNIGGFRTIIFARSYAVCKIDIKFYIYMTYQLIVAKYNENMDWLQLMDKSKIVVYDKGDHPITDPDIKSIRRKNIGREGETFLFYILENYENLPDYILFCQGHPFEHLDHTTPDNFQEKINELIASAPDKTIPLFRKLYYEKHYCFPAIRSREYLKYFTGIEREHSVFSPGCQYLTTKNDILSKPINFYRRIHAMTINDNSDIHTSHQVLRDFIPHGINGWTIERIYYDILCKFDGGKLPPYMTAKRYVVTNVRSGSTEINLVNKLLEEGNNVVVVDNLTTDEMCNIKPVLEKYPDQLQFIEGDIKDEDVLYRVGIVDQF